MNTRRNIDIPVRIEKEAGDLAKDMASEDSAVRTLVHNVANFSSRSQMEFPHNRATAMLMKYLDSTVNASNAPAKETLGSKLNVTAATIVSGPDERTHWIIPSYVPQRNRPQQEWMKTVSQRTGLLESSSSVAGSS